MDTVNGCIRINQPTLDLLENTHLLDEVRTAVKRGDSKRSIGRRFGLYWRQVDILVEHLKRRGAAM